MYNNSLLFIFDKKRTILDIKEIRGELILNRIKELRERRGIGQKELAEKIGVTQQTISLYEKGQREPKLKTWQKIANFFEVSVPYIRGLTIRKEDILKVVNDEYYHYYANRKDPFSSYVSRHLKLIGAELPENMFSKKDFVDFTPRIRKYWNGKFEFLYYCDRITSIAELYTREELKSNSLSETFTNQVIWSIDEVDTILTSTEISKEFNEIVEDAFASFASKRQEIMRFWDKKDISETVKYMAILLFEFSEEVEKLPDNNKKQYSPEIVQKRLDKFIKESKARQKSELFQDLI